MLLLCLNKEQRLEVYNDQKLIARYGIEIYGKPNSHAMLHSNRGLQFTRAPFVKDLKQHGMSQSMSRVGNSVFDNGPDGSKHKPSKVTEYNIKQDNRYKDF